MTVDQETRASLLGDFERTFFVEAGAGTGKTTIIVGRIVNLVAAAQVAMEQLVAITFTEAAAAELRDRVREGLERAADERADPDERARCRRAVEEIDLAAIQTIHAFCGALLRGFPLEAGLPPGFATLDEIEQGLLFEERFRAWFWGAALEPPAREILRRALLLGLTQGQLHGLAAALDAQHDLLTASTVWQAPQPEDAPAVAHALGRRVLALAGLTVYAQDGADDPLAKVVMRAQPGAERLVEAADEEQALVALRDLAWLKAGVGNQKNWGRLEDGRNACAAIKAEINEIRASIADTLESHRQALLAEVLRLLRDFVLDGVARRKRDGVATFQDLLAWARDLLRDNPDVRRRAQRRYRRIFVDEFQDTDPLQAEIVFYLAAEPDQPPPADWRETRLVAGKLFVVGDPKQSIYRFRRADIAVYDALLRRLEEARAQLVQNFRSVRPLIDWVNHHFMEHMQEVEGVQPRYAELTASWETHEGGGRCGVYRVGGELEGLNAAQVAQAEARALAGLVQSVVGRTPVSEREPSGSRRLRPAEHRDVCILLRSRTHLRSLERALERTGVPYRIESGRLMLATQEVRDLLACLRAIEDPSDQVALVGALRSPAYACADPDLLRWVEGGGRLSHERPGDGPDGPVKQALTSLAAFHRRRHLLSPPALIEAFIRDRLLIAAAFDEPQPREAWRRLRYVVSRARTFTASGRHSLRAFLDWIDGLERAELREAESSEAEPDEDAVRILTVHGSKGLEFPIVLLAGLGTTPGGSRSGVEVLPDRSDGSLACRAGDWHTPDYEAAREREKQMAEAETVRLLYVATTRARDHLVLSLHRDAKGDGTPAALIARRLEGYAGECFELEVGAGSFGGGVRRGEGAGLRQTAVGDFSEEGERAWVERRAELIGRLAAPPSLVGAGPEAEASRQLGDDRLSEERPDGEADLGRAVRTLIRRARDSGASLEVDAEPRAIELAESILNSLAYQQGMESPTRWYDLPLLATADGLLVEVSIDLVYETAEGVVLVLYDLPGAPPTNATGARSDLIARAFEAVTGRRVHAVEIVSGRTTACRDMETRPSRVVPSLRGI